MSLKINYKEETFDLPNDFSIEIENTSPIFNERGSQSVSATLPLTRNNLRITGHLNRLDIENNPNNDKTINISDGAIRRIGKINFTQVSRLEGFTFNIGFDEGEIYNLWNDVSLRSLPNLPIDTFESTSSLINHLQEIMLEKEANPALHIFPICVNMPSVHDNDEDIYYPEYLNKFRRKTVVPSGTNTYTLNGSARKENFVISGKVVETTLPEGYGITPFLKVSWIMEFIFSVYGYKILDNPIATHPQLRRLVVLNNAADCCVKAQISYADLMPDCTINEFFQALYCRFGLIFFIDGNTKSVRFKFLKDILSSPAVQDWSKLKADYPLINYTAGQQLRLSAKTSISGPYPSLVAAPSADSLDRFLEPYGHIVGKTYAGGYLSWSDGYYFVRKISTQELDAVSSDFFPWDKNADLDYHEIASVDECLPMKWTYPDNNTYSCPAYLFGKVHRYTNIASADVDIDKEDRSTPLCFCFAHPCSSTKFPYGSPRCTGPNGSPSTESGHTYDISMTFVGDDGLFNRFWKEYDAMLRHANHTVEIPMHLSWNLLQNTDYSIPISIDGQRLLIDQQRYQLPLHSNTPATVLLRTLKLLKPYDLNEEQTVVILPQLYKWEFINNRETIFNSVSGEQVRQWRINLASNATWLGTVRKNEVSEQVSDDELPYLIPTQEDYDSKRSYWIRKVKYSCDLYYKYRVVDRYTSQGTPIYKDYEKGGVHYDIEYDLSVQATTV